jgi:hypothetical protein
MEMSFNINLFENNQNVACNEVLNYHITKYWPRNDPNLTKGYLILTLPPGNTLMVPDPGKGHL